MSHLLSLPQISQMLAERIDALAPELLPGGHREGREWRAGSLAGEAGQSLAVHLGGDRAGVWSDFASGEAGDALDLVAAVLFRGDKREAVRWARRWLGLEDLDPAALQIRRREIAAKATARAEEDRANAEKRRSSAYRLWLQAEERIAGTPADLYLRSRGIELDRLGRQPRALRYHPRLWSSEAGACLPALVTAIAGERVDPDSGEISEGFLAVHRTWLGQDKRGRWGKADLVKPKLVLGDYRGGSIRLWRGASRRPLGRAGEGEAVLVSEGLEDGLTAALACPDYRVIAAVSLGNLQHLRLPGRLEVTILAQNEWDNAQALTGLDRGVTNLLRQGHQVRLARPANRAIKDINDLLTGRRDSETGGAA